MNLPTVKTISRDLLVSNEDAKRIRSIMELVRDNRRRPYHALQEIDTILSNFGIESIVSKNGNGDYNYSNAGDSYCATVMYNHSKDRFVITSWGDIVEKNMENY